MAEDLNSFNELRNATGRKDMREDAIRKYGYFLGGTDVTNQALQQYDMMRTGYGRLFILQMPKFVQRLLPEASNKVRHLLQFANVGVDGIQGYSVEFASMTAGYAGNTVEIPVNAKDDTNSITVKIYETSASLIQSYIDFWITGVCDPQTGMAHYHGAMDLPGSTIPYVSQAFHTMEALYVATDPSGQDVQYACLLANMFPKGSDHSHFAYEPGSHDLVQLSIEFTAMKYMSPQITKVGKQMIKNYAVMKNYMNFQSSYSIHDKNKWWSEPPSDAIWETDSGVPFDANGNLNYDSKSKTDREKIKRVHPKTMRSIWPGKRQLCDYYYDDKDGAKIFQDRLSYKRPDGGWKDSTTK